MVFTIRHHIVLIVVRDTVVMTALLLSCVIIVKNEKESQDYNCNTFPSSRNPCCSTLVGHHNAVEPVIKNAYCELRDQTIGQVVTYKIF